MFQTPYDLYHSKEWQRFTARLKNDRINEDGFIICAHCGKPIIKKYDCIAHHTVELTDGQYVVTGPEQLEDKSGYKYTYTIDSKNFDQDLEYNVSIQSVDAAGNKNVSVERPKDETEAIADIFKRTREKITVKIKNLPHYLSSIFISRQLLLKVLT